MTVEVGQNTYLVGYMAAGLGGQHTYPVLVVEVAVAVVVVAETVAVAVVVVAETVAVAVVVVVVVPWKTHETHPQFFPEPDHQLFLEPYQSLGSDHLQLLLQSYCRLVVGKNYVLLAFYYIQTIYAEHVRQSGLSREHAKT